tara:strand:- start:133 stop:936 length:804 start_codon:yes stop_codon:yes gene_type:complete
MATSIAVASGKGGVGKTSMSVNLSLTFAQMGNKTTLLDADFGMANAHILLGVKPNYFISDTLNGKASLSQTLCSGPVGLKFASGGSGLIDMLNLDTKTRYQTIRLFDEIVDDTDILVADVPAGASDSSLAFVSAADKVLVVLVGEPTSFLDAYSLIKAAHLEASLTNFSVVVNMTQSEAQAKAHFDKFKSIVQKFLDVTLDYVGHLPLSNRLRQSIVTRKPICIDAKDSRENGCFKKIAKNILNSPKNETGGVRFFDQQIVRNERVG